MQLLLSEEQFDFYKKLSEERGQPVSELIRRAMDETFRPATSVRALQALRKITATDYDHESGRPGLEGSPTALLVLLEESRAL